MSDDVNGGPPAILLDTFYASLDVARSLGRRGIPVRALDIHGPRVGTRSRYLTFLGAPANEDELLERLRALGRDSARAPVLFPLSDENLLFLAHHENELAGKFLFHLPRSHRVEDLVSKSRSIPLLEALGVECPRALVLDGSTSVEDVNELRYPVILKPQFHDAWLGNPAVRRRIGAAKVLFVPDRETLARRSDELRGFDVLVAQEFVPGGSENLFYYVGYRSREGVVIGSFVGQKVRTVPDGLGTESLLRSVHRPEIVAVCERILHGIDHVGVAGIDLKLDDRDGRYKVIEINWRLGLSDGLPVACGFDVPYIYYRDVQGLPVQKIGPYPSHRYWCWLERDVDWVREYGRVYGVGRLAWLLDHLRRRPQYVTLSRDDPGPFLWELRRLAGRLAGRVGRGGRRAR